MANATSRARVGVLATGVHYRHPGLLVKIVTTLDVLSGGRFEVLRRHCENVGRRYEDIKRTALASLPMGGGMSIPDVLALCRSAADVGVQELIVMLDEPHELEHLETLGAEVVPVVAEW